MRTTGSFALFVLDVARLLSFPPARRPRAYILYYYTYPYGTTGSSTVLRYRALELGGVRRVRRYMLRTRTSLVRYGAEVTYAYI